MYENLVNSRNLVKITQKELAKLLGILQSSYSMKETGHNSFTVDEAIEIYKYINKKLNKDDKIPFEKMFKKKCL